MEKDKHQEEIIAVEQSYKERSSQQINDWSAENAALKALLVELQSRVDLNKGGMMSPEPESIEVQISSSKSDDGWQINGN